MAYQHKGTPRSHLRHGHVVDEKRHLVAVRRAEVLAAPLVELGLDGVLRAEPARRISVKSVRTGSKSIFAHGHESKAPRQNAEIAHRRRERVVDRPRQHVQRLQEHPHCCCFCGTGTPNQQRRLLLFMSLFY